MEGNSFHHVCEGYVLLWMTWMFSDILSSLKWTSGVFSGTTPAIYDSGFHSLVAELQTTTTTTTSLILLLFVQWFDSTGWAYRSPFKCWNINLVWGYLYGTAFLLWSPEVSHYVYCSFTTQTCVKHCAQHTQTPSCSLQHVLDEMSGSPFAQSWMRDISVWCTDMNKYGCKPGLFW